MGSWRLPPLNEIGDIYMAPSACGCAREAERVGYPLLWGGEGGGPAWGLRRSTLLGIRGRWTCRVWASWGEVPIGGSRRWRSPFWGSLRRTAFGHALSVVAHLVVCWLSDLLARPCPTLGCLLLVVRGMLPREHCLVPAWLRGRAHGLALPCPGLGSLYMLYMLLG